jgi:hypothetical protein
MGDTEFRADEATLLKYQEDLRQHSRMTEKLTDLEEEQHEMLKGIANNLRV